MIDLNELIKDKFNYIKLKLYRIYIKMSLVSIAAYRNFNQE